MSMWRCPHCGSPQAETARCWVCHRSSTICSTCRNFRRSVAGQVGFCGLDRRRMPLSGAEHRGCWEAKVGAAAETPVPDVRVARRDADRGRDFIPVELLAEHVAASAALEPRVLVPGGRAMASRDIPRAESAPLEPWRDRRTLFGEADR